MFRQFWTEKKNYYLFLALILLISFLSSYGVYILERESNYRFDQAVELFYWWVASFTTIGYSGMPISGAGKVLGMITMISGSFVYLAVFTELILILKEKADERFKGISNYSGENHIVILGYNNLALGLINFLDRVLKPEIDIILITSSIETNPNVDRIKFIKMNPLTLDALKRANVVHSSVAFILSRDEITEKKSDLNVLLLGGMIEEIDERVFTLVEINNDGNPEELRKFKIDAEFSFEELVEDTRNNPTESILLSKIPKEISKKLVREEYL